MGSGSITTTTCNARPGHAQALPPGQSVPEVRHVDALDELAEELLVLGVT